MIDPNCPYSCNNQNEILDRTRACLIPCPHCIEYATDNSVKDVKVPLELGFPSQVYATGNLNIDAVIPPSESNFLDPDSYEEFQDKILNLYSSVRQGILPSRSMCIGLGIKGRIAELAYPLMASAYRAGLTVHPIVTVSDISSWKIEENGAALRKLYTDRFVIIVLEEGTARVGLQVAKGVMQARALKHLPTIFITTWEFNSVVTLVDKDPDSGKFLADPCFVFYKTSKMSSYSMGILGLDNSIIGGADSEDSEYNFHED